MRGAVRNKERVGKGAVRLPEIVVLIMHVAGSDALSRWTKLLLIVTTAGMIIGGRAPCPGPRHRAQACLRCGLCAGGGAHCYTISGHVWAVEAKGTVSTVVCNAVSGWH